MTAQISIHGRLGSDPVERTSNSGTIWATTSIAEAPCRQSKGDLLSASGRLQLNRWNDKEGQQREQLQVVAETIISARTTRPGRPGKSRSSNHG